MLELKEGATYDDGLGNKIIINKVIYFMEVQLVDYTVKRRNGTRKYRGTVGQVFVEILETFGFKPCDEAWD